MKGYNLKILCDTCSNYCPCPSGQNAYLPQTCQGRDFGLGNASKIRQDVMDGKDKRCPSYDKLRNN